MNNDVKLVIYLVYRLRKVMQLSQHKGHKLFGITYSSYYKIEKFNHNLSIASLFYILKLFNISLAEFQSLLDLVTPFKDELTNASTVSDADDVIGFRSVAEVDTAILNLIKDTETYKLNRKVK